MLISEVHLLRRVCTADTQITQGCLAEKAASISFILQRNNCLPAHLRSATFLRNPLCMCVCRGLGRNVTVKGKFGGK